MSRVDEFDLSEDEKLAASRLIDKIESRTVIYLSFEQDQLLKKVLGQLLGDWSPE